MQQNHVWELSIYVQRAMQGTTESRLLLMNIRFEIREVREFSAATAADSLQIVYRTFYRPGNFRWALPRATGPEGYHDERRWCRLAFAPGEEGGFGGIADYEPGQMYYY